MGIETIDGFLNLANKKKCMKDSSDLSRTSTLDPKASDCHQWI